MLGDPLFETLLGLAPQLRRFGLGALLRRRLPRQERREDRLALKRPIGAAARDLDGVVERFGQIGEELPHRLAGLEVMLRAQAAPVVNGDIASFGDAEQRVMRLEIVHAREIGLVGRDNGDVEVVGEREQKGLDRALLGQPVALELDVKPVAENALELLGAARGQARYCLRRGFDRSVLQVRR